MMKITAPVVFAFLAVIAEVAIIAGVAMLGGLAWGLIVGGVLVLMDIGVLLYDPDPKRISR